MYNLDSIKSIVPDFSVARIDGMNIFGMDSQV